MHIRKQQRRERALARFTIQSEDQFNNGLKANKRNVGDYRRYLARKQIERLSLEGNV